MIRMTNKEIADAIIRGKKKTYLAKNEKLATAIRVAGHRLGSVLTVKKEKKGWRLVKSTARVWHKKKAAKSSVKGARSKPPVARSKRSPRKVRR